MWKDDRQDIILVEYIGWNKEIEEEVNNIEVEFAIIIIYSRYKYNKDELLQ